jgi:hypothetical protein
MTVTADDVVVSTTQHDDRNLVECSMCGPVFVTDLGNVEAVLAHLAPVHGITQVRQVEKP